MVTCEKVDYCSGKDKQSDWVSIDWDDDQSIHNLIEQLDFFCEPAYMIGLIGAMFLCGIVIGCMTLTRMGDVVGRKPIYMLGVLMHIGVMCGLLLSTDAYFDFLLVFLFGMSVTARYYVGYAYNLEMQPKSHYVLVSTSMFLIESVVYITICLYFWLVKGPWQILQIPNLALSMMGIAFLFFMPESPRFLISKKRYEEARTIFKWIGR